MSLPVNILDMQPIEVPGEKIYELLKFQDCSIAYAQIEESKAHYHVYTKEWYLVAKGEGNVFLEGRPVRLMEGDIIPIPLGTVHKAKRTGEQFNVYVITSPPWSAEDHHIVE